MARRTAILSKLLPGEKAIFAKGEGLDNGEKTMVPFKGAWRSLTLDQQMHNSAINTVLVDVMRTIRMIKVRLPSGGLAPSLRPPRARLPHLRFVR